jgi:hypothetical protein
MRLPRKRKSSLDQLVPISSFNKATVVDEYNLRRERLCPASQEKPFFRKKNRLQRDSVTPRKMQKKGANANDGAQRRIPSFEAKISDLLLE